VRQTDRQITDGQREREKVDRCILTGDKIRQTDDKQRIVIEISEI
jgi:hypothetical protein